MEEKEKKEFGFTKQQAAAIAHRGGALLVSAAAGSGKTKVLVERLLSRVEEGSNIDEFLVITYTRAAASELREKIYDEIMERLADCPDNRRLRRQSVLCRAAPIGTIHSFCTDILRENAYAAQLPPDFRVLDESESGITKIEVLDKVLSAAYETAVADDQVSYDSFRQLVNLVSPGRDDKKLADIILSVHTKLQSNPNPTAWAQEQAQRLDMTGVSDISTTVWGAYLLDKARKIADFWWEEMQRLRAEMLSLPDFERAYGSSIQTTISGIEAFRTALDDGWDEARRFSNIEFSRALPLKAYEELKELRQRCKDALKKLPSLFECSSEEHIEDMLAVAKPMKALLHLVLDFDRAYSEEKRRKGVVDFSDLEHLTYSLLVDKNARDKTGLASAISQRYKEIMVDEYQDVNEIQELLFNAVSQDGHNIFMVGDVKQSIYRFRLADPSIFLEKYKKFADAGHKSEHVGFGTKILLSKNFRSRTAILEAVNLIFSKIMSVEFGEMDYSEREMLVPGLEAQCDLENRDRKDKVSPTVEVNLIDLSGIERDEDEESPTKTQAEARYIAEKIAELTSGRHLISDGKEGKRVVEYSDIVILLRSVAGKAWIYAQALLACDIPVDMPGGEGFFETVEIKAALSLLAVIDNPMQDILLAGALKGPVYSFSADELAQIRACSKTTDFYTALLHASVANAQGNESESGGHIPGLCEKCSAFLNDIEAFRLVVPDLPADRFIWHMYNKTGLLERVSAMSGGEKRRSNLILLAESARVYEQSGYKGLFGFLTYIDGLQKRGAEPVRDGGAASEEAINAVRIMSIHKSKGLEFPVVILADTSKQLNNKDALQSLVMHPEFGLGPMRIDEERRIEYTTIARMAIQSKLTSEMMAEELRILYVAMTRAKEKLLITAALKDAKKELEKFEKFAAWRPEERLPPQMIGDVKSMAGWILAAITSAQCHSEDLVVSVVDAVEENQSTEIRHQQTDEHPSYPVVESEKSIPIPMFYPYQKAPELPSKLTVTGLNGLQSDKESVVLYSEAEAFNSISVDKQNFAFKRPGFISEKTGLTATERGIALHMVMQHIDFYKCQDAKGIADELHRLTQKGLLKQEQAEIVDVQKIKRFFESEIGKRILSAQNICREFKFSLLYPAEYFYPGGGEDKIMLQGVVDCFFEENGNLTVIDFKTDYLTPETLEEKTRLYEPQLKAYAEALERITGKTVGERIIYFFYLDYTQYLK
ncbi:MAG: helicase-exonuclease AddAB subunit AddA [Oscillospiraceae bacterium]|nr:helicase-exonuclease AddAB subunit AddA [Oscillospiraceae bacterium]